ncbi:MAG: hypothetical protein Q8R04_00620 [Nanoarchaeota archaeon]|nr:hypothetical protein [Nanoarchaeota archaeon]
MPPVSDWWFLTNIKINDKNKIMPEKIKNFRAEKIAEQFSPALGKIQSINKVH